MRALRSLAALSAQALLICRPGAAQLPEVPTTLTERTQELFQSGTFAPRERFGPAARTYRTGRAPGSAP